MLSSTSLWSPPSSSTAVKHGLCWLTLKKRIQAFETKDMRKLFRISYFEHKTNDWLRGQEQLPCGSTGTFSGNCHKTEICMVRACRTPRQHLQNHPSGHLRGWATPWQAEEMLDGQHQSGQSPCQSCSQGSPAEKSGRGYLPNRPL